VPDHFRIVRFSQRHRRSESDGNSFIKNAGNFSPLAGPASQLMNQGNASTISSGSALPGLATLAAAGASAGVAVNRSKFSGAANSTEGPSGAAPAVQSSSPPATADPVSTPFGGDLGSPKNALARNLASPDSPQGSDGVKAPVEPGVYQLPQSAGASQPIGGKAAVAAKSDAGAYSSAGEAAVGKKADDIPGGFSTSLDPRAVPKSSTSVGGEVASLLGQMKSMFNLDDPALGEGGAGGGPGLAPAPGAPAGESPEALDAGEEESYADGNGAAPESGRSTQADTAHESQLGSLNKSLFARIRQRHVRCMEKGLVLYGLRERVE
jgi:hypothetical protein